MIHITLCGSANSYESEWYAWLVCSQVPHELDGYLERMKRIARVLTGIILRGHGPAKVIIGWKNVIVCMDGNSKNPNGEEKYYWTGGGRNGRIFD